MGTVTKLTNANILKRMLSGWLAVLLLAGTARASSWWDAEWTVRRKITVDTTGKLQSTQVCRISLRSRASVSSGSAKMSMVSKPISRVS